MGTLRVVDGEQRRNVPLAASTLVGRGWPCHVVLTHPAAPLYWLEIRWYGGAWAWRTLAADARTRGVGAFVGWGRPDGRRFRSSARPHRPRAMAGGASRGRPAGSKLRAQLSRAGATGVDALYEIRRDGDTVRARVRAT